MSNSVFTVTQGLRSFFPPEPTPDQEVLIDRLADYLVSDRKDVFIMRGYAGTGKTTAISALVNYRNREGKRTVLLAPTGRAARVMAEYSRFPAFTIHKYIYRVSDDDVRGYGFELKANRNKNTLFIVDEASMIHEDDSSGMSLLGDVLEFVKEHRSNKLIFSGDIAQLPPVHSDLSGALIPKRLRDYYGCKPWGAELKDVVRQASESGILEVATRIRLIQESGDFQKAPDLTTNKKDVKFINGNELSDELEQVIRDYGESGFVIITRSNKLANIFNEQVRRGVLYREDFVDAGDLLMVVQNNYFWKGEGIGDFIANGDIMNVQRTTEIEEKYGFKFMDCSVLFSDDEADKQYDVKLLLDVLSEPDPKLTYEKKKELYQAVFNEYQGEVNTKREAILKVKDDPYYNALQVKFAYSVTCHKAQGGQWPAVFVDHSFFNEDKLGKGYLRWVYTAATRAKEQLFFVNLPEFFPGVEQQ